MIVVSTLLQTGVSNMLAIRRQNTGLVRAEHTAVSLLKSRK